MEKKEQATADKMVADKMVADKMVADKMVVVTIKKNCVGRFRNATPIGKKTKVKADVAKKMIELKYAE